MDKSTPDPFYISAKKSLGQHFLNSPIVPTWLCETAELNPDRPVLEIGPGTGVLTQELLKRGVTVVALETDTRSIATLHERFCSAIENEQLHIYEGDARDGIPAHPLLTDHSYQVVANIPYYLTGLILRTYLESTTQPTRMTLLVQKEVAERIARSQKSSLLQIAVKVFGTPRYVRTVKSGHFSPAPRVDSAILDITDITHQHIPPTSRDTFFRLVKAGFAHKRKQLAHNLQKTYPQKAISEILLEIDIPPSIRAENVDLETWLKLNQTMTDTE